MAYEIKYRENPKLHPKEALVQWVNSSNPPSPPQLSFLITKNPTDYGPIENGRIHQIPAFLLTYLLGYMEHQKWNSRL
jgi:hypothetical protein